MSSLNFAGDSGSLSDINLTQGLKRSQIAALNDLMKQIAGNAAVSAGNTAQADPLNSPFELFVNPYIGSDEFVGGSYNDYETGTDAATMLASKLKRLEKQRLTCGFSPQRPFKTINRAVIEAAIITSKNWYTDYSDAGQVDCVSIKLSSGVHTVHNDPGSSSTSLASWGTSKTPTTAELIAFNPSGMGGVLLPRGCSLKGDDLRKISLRPTHVPTSADEATDYSNRQAIFKITGTGYYFGFTFLDKTNHLFSHHLLDPFQFASKADLDGFYAKCESAVGTGADLSSALIKTRSTEYQIVGPIDITESPTSAWDTTKSASPYIFNVSVRSEYGMGGAFMDGAKNEGLSSMVCANFTGVSLQKDMSCWQIYSNGTWTNLANTEAAYETYINTEPDNVRMDPKRLSRHISAINNAVIQEVSVFSIGHGVQHFTDLGGEVTITNSNSSFGGCSALSKGYKTFSFPQDKNWSVAKIEVPLNLSEKTNNIQRIYLGTVSAISDTLITLTSGLEIASNSTTIPNVLYKDGYSLKHNTRVWVENPLGADWQTSLTASAWSSSSPTLINVTAALAEGNSAGTAPGTNPDTGNSLAVGKRVYIRRLADTRTPSERRMALQLTNTSSARIPERNFVLQTDPNRASGAISRELAKWTTAGGGAEVFTVESSGVGSESGVTRSAAITLRRAAPDVSYSNGGFFRAGTVVKHANKHFQALRDQTTTTATPSPNDWAETFVHMPEDYCAEDNRLNTAPILVIDTDTDSTDTSTTLGINFTTGWTTAGDLRTQYESGTDYQGVYAFLIALGFSASNVMNSLKPQVEANRKLDPVNQLTGEPSGGAATAVGNWAVEFRRPSVLRLFAHSWEFNGALNYSKALPAAQKTIGPQNKFTYYFTNEAGGRVVPQGSNEEGFNITPRGLEDVETGATISVENIDNSTIDDTQVTNFSDLSVDNLTINSTVTFPESAKASTSDAGIVSGLASLADLRDTASASSNTAIDSDQVVTKKGLEYWKTYNGLLSSPQSGTQTLYVNLASSNTFTTVEEVLANPPTSVATAITRLDLAADYAATVFSPSVLVEYRISAGLYTDSVCTFTTKTQIRAWDFTSNSELNNKVNGGASPFFGANGDTYSNFTTVTAQPTFPTTFKVKTIRNAQNSLLISAKPKQFIFEEEATITGVVWLGIVDTILSSLPDSSYPTQTDYGVNGTGTPVTVPVTEWRTGASREDALNRLFRSFVARNYASGANEYIIYGMRQIPAIIFRKGGAMNNIAFGAMKPSSTSINRGTDSDETLVGLCSSDEQVTMNGIRLVGSVKVSSEDNTGSSSIGGYDFTKVRLRTSSTASTQNYRFSGHSYSLCSCQAGNTTLRVAFGTTNSQTDGQNFTSNFNYNNITLLNNNKTVANVGDAATNTNFLTIGPSFGQLIDGPVDTIAPHDARQFNQFGLGASNVSNNSAGFNGKFGQYNASVTSGTTGTDEHSKGINFASYGKFSRWSRLYESQQQTTSFFRVAGSGNIPDTASYVPNTLGLGASGTPAVYTLLNISLTGYKKGVDTSTGRIIGNDDIF